MIDGGNRTCVALLIDLRDHIAGLAPGTVVHLVATDSGDKQWTWEVPTLDAVPDVAPAIELTSRYQPSAGPMLIPGMPP
jgi:hypothetical protein